MAIKIREYSPKYNKLIVVEVKHPESYYRAPDYQRKYLENNLGGYCHIDLKLLERKNR